MFPLEGLPCAVLGVLVPMLLDESPEASDWLSTREETMIAAMLEAEAPASEGQTFAQILRNPCLYALMAVYFSFTAAISVLQFWLLTIIRSLGVTDVALIGLYSAIPVSARRRHPRASSPLIKRRQEPSDAVEARRCRRLGGSAIG